MQTNAFALVSSLVCVKSVLYLGDTQLESRYELDKVQECFVVWEPEIQNNLRRIITGCLCLSWALWNPGAYRDRKKILKVHEMLLQCPRDTTSKESQHNRPTFLRSAVHEPTLFIIIPSNNRINTKKITDNRLSSRRCWSSLSTTLKERQRKRSSSFQDIKTCKWVVYCAHAIAFCFLQIFCHSLCTMQGSGMMRSIKKYFSSSLF